MNIKQMTLICMGACGLLAASGAGWAGMDENISREKIAGVDVLVYPTAVQDVVNIVGSLPAGSAQIDDGNIVTASLAAMMLDRGTTRQDKFAIALKLESVGARISFGADSQLVNIRARCLKQDLPLVIGLIAEQLRMPAFDAEEFEKARQQFIGSVKNSIEDTGFRAQNAFSRLVFPEGHPNRAYTAEQYLAAAESVTLEEVKAFHQKYYGPAYMTLVLVGDVSMPVVREEVDKAFQGWSGGVDVVRATREARLGQGREENVELAGKTSVTMVWGQPSGLRYSDPDALALRVATAILGSGFTGRLMANVRDKEGLTYGIGAGLGSDTFNDGVWSISATFAPQLLDKGIESTRRQLMRWWNEGVTADELEARKENLVGSYQVGLATTGGLAANILATVQRGYPLSWLDEYPEAVRALTLDEVNAAIKKYLDPQKMVLVKAGTFEAAAASATE